MRRSQKDIGPFEGWVASWCIIWCSQVLMGRENLARSFMKVRRGVLLGPCLGFMLAKVGSEVFRSWGALGEEVYYSMVELRAPKEWKRQGGA
jgi:hypothetical protein